MASRRYATGLAIVASCAVLVLTLRLIALGGILDPRDWKEGEIDEVLDKVRDIFFRVRENIPLKPPDGNATNIVTKLIAVENNLNGQLSGTVLKELKDQLEELESKGPLLKEGVEDILASVNSRLADYRAFVGSGENKCAAGTRCDAIREEFLQLLADFAALSDLFPLIAVAGLDDTSQDRTMIENTPPIALFFLEGPWQRVRPLLETIPEDLREVFAAVNDPDIFTLEFARSGFLQGAGAANLQAANVPPGTPPGAPPGANPRELCNELRLLPVLDPIRLNRIRLLLALFSGGLNFINEIEFGQCVDVVGEGTCVPVKFRVVNRLRLLKWVVDSIDAAIATRRANLDLCNL